MDGDDAQRPSGTEPSDGRELSPSGARPSKLDPLPSGNPNASTQLSLNRQRLMAEQQRPKTIFLMGGGRIKKTQWTGVTFEELQNLYIEVCPPTAPCAPTIQRGGQGVGKTRLAPCSTAGQVWATHAQKTGAHHTVWPGPAAGGARSCLCKQEAACVLWVHP